jgi:AcrR family transcriptional regulator
MSPSPLRERILDAAETEFFHNGIAVTGVDQVASSAGVAIATLYKQFGSKDNVLREVLSRRLATWTQHWESAIGAATSPEDRLLAIFDAVETFRASAGHTQWCCFLATASERPRPSSPDRVYDLIEEDTHRVVARLEQLAQEAGYTDPEMAAAQVLLLYNGILSSLLRGRPHEPVPMARQLAATVLEGATSGPASLQPLETL